MRSCTDCTKERKQLKALSAKRQRRELRLQIKGLEPRYRGQAFFSSYQSYRDEKERDGEFFKKISSGRALPEGYSLRRVLDKSKEHFPIGHSLRWDRKKPELLIVESKETNTAEPDALPLPD